MATLWICFSKMNDTAVRYEVLMCTFLCRDKVTCQHAFVEATAREVAVEAAAHPDERNAVAFCDANHMLAAVPMKTE